jgi:hypothetical protein
MTNNINSHDVKVLATGIAVGGAAATYIWSRVFGKVLIEKSTQNALKTQFINWMMLEGIHLPEEKVYTEAQTRWDFINQVTKK